MLMASLHSPPSDESATESWMADLVSRMGMRLLIDPKAKYCSTPGNEGITCICAIETSHIVLHVWDGEMPAKMQLDVYTCSPLRLPVVWASLRGFKAFDIKYKFYDRENSFTLLNDAETKRIESNLLSNVWHFAKTMPQIPHWYTRGREWASIDEFAEAVDLIDRMGVKEKWGKRAYRYYYIGDYKYWTMEAHGVPSHDHILINRAKA